MDIPEVLLDSDTEVARYRIQSLQSRPPKQKPRYDYPLQDRPLPPIKERTKND